MSNFLVFSEFTEPFVVFSLSHLAGVLVVFLCLVLMVLFRRNMLANDHIWRRVFAITLITQEIVLNINRLVLGVWSFEESLPLHLCSFSVILIAIMMLTDSKEIFEVIYYWGIVGAVVGMLTPNLEAYAFPHFRYYQFFLSHGLILVGTFYMLVVRGWLPGKGSLIKTMVYTNILLPLIGVINWITGGNYFFVARKLDTASPLDLLPEWPYYIIHMEVIAFGLFVLLTIPVVVIRRRREVVD